MKRSSVILFIMGIVYGYLYAGDSQLHIAAHEGSEEKVRELLSKGASPFDVNKKGLLPVQSAANNEIRAILIAAMNEWSAKARQKESL